MAFRAQKRFRGIREIFAFNWKKNLLESNILTTAIARQIHVHLSLWQLPSAILWNKQGPPQEIQVHIHRHNALINKI